MANNNKNIDKLNGELWICDLAFLVDGTGHL